MQSTAPKQTVQPVQPAQPVHPVRLAVIPGDGVGPEVIEQALRVLQAIEEATGHRFHTVTFPWSSEHYLQTGHVAPPGFLDTLRGFDAILLGAMGDPRVPDPISVGLVLQIRKGFDLYVNLRPVRRLSGAPSPLAHAPTVDILFVRENTEGEYSDAGGRLNAGHPDELALHTAVFTRRGIERIAVFAFEQARHRRRIVTSVSKGNALPHTFGLWDEVVRDVARHFPDVRLETVLVDAMAYHLVRQPERFDVVVASNLFGDILTDLGAALQGGLGLAASANINPAGPYPGMFEPVHGSAPDIAGRGIANPIGAIWSAALMLDYLKDRGRLPNGDRLAGAVLQAIADVLREGPHTPDLGGTATTREVGEAVVRQLARLL
ncbi:tartrate dehydrogenase [Thermaerobacter sp. PB12/4term]|uniref:isocitrate/isopropylmalate dehydrogenase family protein n=1 Tax=Thermaerobacter sp. PB12/4term TaxID=2293838 RepID=UPI000E327FBD|nr:isocitrate/isopropylmalate family dehydrogenase [Thermaerobacter sp. PB12/4term]QIA27628.1 tartrate dehydrogenase [Thermaerobacter sp. PB12/4term]